MYGRIWSHDSFYNTRVMFDSLGQMAGLQFVANLSHYPIYPQSIVNLNGPFWRTLPAQPEMAFTAVRRAGGFIRPPPAHAHALTPS